MERVLATWTAEVQRFTDSQLMARLRRVAGADRKLVARMIVYLGEVDSRGLYREQAYSSLFSYAVEEFRMSEAEAYLRIYATRLARKYPIVIERLAAGAVSLTALKLIGPLLTVDNHVQLLERVRGRSKREVERVVAEAHPMPDVPSRMRKLPGSALSVAPPLPAGHVKTPANISDALLTCPKLANAAEEVAEVSQPERNAGVRRAAAGTGAAPSESTAQPSPTESTERRRWPNDDDANSGTYHDVPSAGDARLDAADAAAASKSSSASFAHAVATFPVLCYVRFIDAMVSSARSWERAGGAALSVGFWRSITWRPMPKVAWLLPITFGSCAERITRCSRSGILAPTSCTCDGRRASKSAQREGFDCRRCLSDSVCGA